MLENKYVELILQLENEELENVNLTADVYSQLFVAYLFQDKLTDAKHLWFRIPSAMKSEHKELLQLQQLSEALQKNNFADFFTLIKYDWSEHIKQTMSELLLKIREDVLLLTGFAYSSIYEQNLLNMTQLTPEELKTACNTLGWSSEVDGQQKIVLPKPQEVKTVVGADDQLIQLTEFVSFLEN